MQHRPYDPFRGTGYGGKSNYGSWSSAGPGVGELLGRGLAALWRRIVRPFRRRAEGADGQQLDADSVDQVKSSTPDTDVGAVEPEPVTAPLPRAEAVPEPPEESRPAPVAASAKLTWPRKITGKEARYRWKGDSGYSGYYLELAKMFHTGDGMPQDLDRAIEYYWLASRSREFIGHSYAAAQAAKLERQQHLDGLSPVGRLGFYIRESLGAAGDQLGIDAWPSALAAWITEVFLPDFARIRREAFRYGWSKLRDGLLLAIFLIPVGLIAVFLKNTTGWEVYGDWVFMAGAAYAVYPGMYMLFGLVLVGGIAVPAWLGKVPLDFCRGVAKALAGTPRRSASVPAAAGVGSIPPDTTFGNGGAGSGGDEVYTLKNWLVGMLLLISVGGAVTYYVVYDEGPWPTMGKGYRLFDAGRYEEATAVFQQVTEAYTDFAEGHAALGHALAARERFDDAIAAYTRAIELDGEYLGARTGRGWVRWFTGRLEGAAEDYRAAVRLDPDVYGYYLELERVLYELDRPREVAEFWKEVADNKPDWAVDARVKRVQALEKDQDWSALRRELPAMMGMDAHKNDPHLDYLMGRSLNEAGRHGRAITFLQRAVNTILAGDPPNKNLLKLYGDELKYTYVWNDQLDEGRSWEQRLNRLLNP